jgi:hypothetical protein
MEKRAVTSALFSFSLRVGHELGMLLLLTPSSRTSFGSALAEVRCETQRKERVGHAHKTFPNIEKVF